MFNSAIKIRTSRNMEEANKLYYLSSTLLTDKMNKTIFASNLVLRYNH